MELVKEVGAGLFSRVTRERMRASGHKLHQERFKLNIRKNSFTDAVDKNWNKLPKERVQAPALEVFNRHVDVAL